MSHELKEGVALNAVHVPGMSYVVDWPTTGSAIADCESIIVAEQTGQMAMVPWAKATLETGAVVLINLANAESVELA